MCYIRCTKKTKFTLFDSGSDISHFLNRLKACSSDSPNNIMGSPRSRNLLMTSLRGSICLSVSASFDSASVDELNDTNGIARFEVIYEIR